MILTFYLSFVSLGPYLSELLKTEIDFLVAKLDLFLMDMAVSPHLRSLVVDGISEGVGSVLSFIPVIFILFFCLSTLESSGYLDFIASLLDDFFAKIGLSGKCFVPLFMGFGCNVPGILYASSMENRHDRFVTTLIVPFMACSAKLTVFSIVASAVFTRHRVVVIFSLYLIGILCGCLFALLGKVLGKFDMGDRLGAWSDVGVKNKLLVENHTPMAEMAGVSGKERNATRLKFPDFMYALSVSFENVLGFIKKAFTVIFLASIVVWVLENFDLSFAFTDSPDRSILAHLGKFLSPVFSIIGLGDWHIVCALIAGISAKEAIISTLSVLALGSKSGILGFFDPLSAYTFLVFCLLYMPCIATLVSISKSLGRTRYAIFLMIFQVILAFFVCFLVYHIGLFLMNL